MASSLGAAAGRGGRADFSQRGSRVTLGSKARSSSAPQAPKGPRSRGPSGPGRPTPGQLARAWNRGGRLRELRARCLARKFFLLWAQRTFGRVSPFRARNHYERRLLQKTFGEWREEWWLCRREWKLRVRADCHYRYSLYNVTFQAWRTYVRRRRDQRLKQRRAEAHAARQTLRPAWKHWLIYVDVRRTKREMRAAAQGFRQQSLLRVPWGAWQRRVRRRREDRAMDALALQHWSISLQFWAWSQWQQQLLRVQIIQRKETEAVRHCQGRERHRALRAWRSYVRGRREKQHRAQLAGQFRCATVVRAGFLVWRAAWEQRKRLRAHQAQIEALAVRTALRHAFERWKHYMLVSAEEAASWVAAEEHHRHRLMLSGFRALKENVARSRLHRLRKNLAHGQYQAMLLQRFWHIWCARVEQREDAKQLPQLLRALSHHREVLLHKCLRLWSRNAQDIRHEKAQSAKAEHFYRTRSLSVLFGAWKSFSCQRRAQRAWGAEAASFHRESVTRWAFDTWWQKMCLQREVRLSQRMAILHAERRVLRSVWFTWRRRAAELSMERRGQAAACAHHRLGQLRKAFRIWKENLRTLQDQRTGALRAEAFHAGLLLRLSWSRWREYVARQNAKWEKAVRAHRHYRRTLLRKALAAWMTYQERVKVVLGQVAEREERHQREHLRWALALWRENALARREEAQKILWAEEHYRRTILRKVFVRWRDTAFLRAHTRQQEATALSEARRQLGRGRLRVLFQRWRERARGASQQRLRLQRAARHHGARLLRAAWARWRAYHAQCVRKKLLQRLAARLEARRLCRSCFSTWKHQLGERRQEQQATVRALWFWSFTLQGKVWDAWLGFVLERRRKKARLERAVLAYHGGLVHEGVTRLLRFTAGMKSFRGRLHARQQAQVAFNLQRVVRRCATRWKHKALAKDSRGAASRKRVTFEVPPAAAPPGAAGEAAPDAERSEAPRGPRKYWGWPLQLASGDPQLPDLNAMRAVRKPPRCPSFLLDSLERDGLAGRLESGCRPLLSAPPGPSASLLAAGPGGRTCTEAPARGPLHAEAAPPPPCSVEGDPDPRDRRAVAVAPSEPGAQEPATALATTGRVQPGGAQLPLEASLGSKGKPGPGAAGADAGRRALGILGDGGELEAELEEIQEKLLSYWAKKQSLRSWQRQASSLREWLELSVGDPRPEEAAAGLQVRLELQQAEEQIGRLTEELRAQRQQVQGYLARIRLLRATIL
ncbi:protein SFI1 homolog [Antechinus flavipes]|uniref:protein SFI1 homolog n=1 Tax=Antechinus flavipes TaxID=38775 RepID=UPI0022369237|nr:protein SFI1 homolog [Antechinus flavipes]